MWFTYGLVLTYRDFANRLVDVLILSTLYGFRRISYRDLRQVRSWLVSGFSVPCGLFVSTLFTGYAGKERAPQLFSKLFLQSYYIFLFSTFQVGSVVYGFGFLQLGFCASF